MAENRATAAFSLKDALFNPEKVTLFAGWFKAADPAFDAAGYKAEVLARFPELELKARIALMSEALERHLPAAFPEAAAVIKAALPPPLDDSLTDDDFGDFIIAPLGDYVMRKGLAA